MDLRIGFGTANIKGNVCESVKAAVRAGCRLIDTAYNYGSEIEVGRALKELFLDHEIEREDIFVQTKLAPRKHGYESTIECFDESLRNLQLEYVDNYFIHWPVPRNMEKIYEQKNRETWRAMEELFFQGKTRMLSVSNFLERHILQIEESARIPISYNQLEIHPMFQQIGLSDHCRKKGIKIQAWAPTGGGRLDETCRESLRLIGERYNKTVQQICLRWNIQLGNIPIFSSGDSDHIKQNMNVFDFALSAEDMQTIAGMNTPGNHLDIWCYDNQIMY